MGSGTLEWVKQYQNQFNVPQLEDFPDFNGGFVGYFGYEIIRYIEPKLENINNSDELGVADILLMVSNDLLVFDNLSSKVHIITHINPSEQSYEDAIEKLDQIEKGIKKPLKQESVTKSKIKSSDFVSSFGKEKFMNSKMKEYFRQKLLKSRIF